MTTRSEPVAPPVPPAVRAGMRSRLRGHLDEPLFRNAYALGSTVVLTSGLGFVYWVIAARMYPPAVLGVGAALVSTMTLLSNITQLNLNTFLARFLPPAGGAGRRLVLTSYVASSVAGLAVSAGFLLVVGRVEESLAFLAESPLLGALFCLSVAAWGIFTLQDSVLAALGRASWVPVENAAFGVAKILLLVAFASGLPALGVFASWNIPVLLAVVPVNLLVFRRLLPRRSPAGAPGTLPSRSDLQRFVALDYVGFLFMQAGTNALPLLVTIALGPEATALFYVAFVLSGALELIAYNFAISLTIEAARDETALARLTRSLLRRALLLFAAPVAVMVLAAPLLLAIFGGQYAADSATLLRLLALAVVPKLVVAVFVATCRVRRRVRTIVAVQAATSTAVLGLSAALVGWVGLTGVGIAYLTAQVLVAAAVLPALVRTMRTADGR